MIDRKNGLTYADSGVDIDAGNRLVDLIKPIVRATARAGADAEIGGFGGLFDLKGAGFKDPVLVAATKTGSLKPAALRSKSPPKPPISASAPARAVARTIGLMRSTRRLPASISTPESA